MLLFFTLTLYNTNRGHVTGAFIEVHRALWGTMRHKNYAFSVPVNEGVGDKYSSHEATWPQRTGT